MTEALFIAITVIDLVAAGIIFGGALSDLTLKCKTWFKTALLIGAIGLTVQGVRNLQFLITGISPTDSDVPLWMLKDLGLAIIAFSYFYLIAKSYLTKRNEPLKSIKAVKVEKPKRKYTRKPKVKGD